MLKRCLWQRLVVLQHSMTLFITVLNMPRTEVLTKLQILTKTNMVVLSFFVETMTNPQVRFIWKWHKNQPFTLASMIDRTMPIRKLQRVLFSTVRKQLPFLIARMLLPSQSTKKHLLPAMLNLHSNKEPWQQSLSCLSETTNSLWVLPLPKCQMVLFVTVRKQLPFLMARMLLPSQSTKNHLLPAMLNLHSKKQPWQQSLLCLPVTMTHNVIGLLMHNRTGPFIWVPKLVTSTRVSNRLMENVLYRV